MVTLDLSQGSIITPYSYVIYTAYLNLVLSRFVVADHQYTDDTLEQMSHDQAI